MCKRILGALAALWLVPVFGADVGASYLYKLRDVSVGSRTNGQALVWDAPSNRWVPGVASSGGSSALFGGGTVNFVAKWTGTNTLGNSAFSDDGTTGIFSDTLLRPSSDNATSLGSSSRRFRDGWFVGYLYAGSITNAAAGIVVRAPVGETVTLGIGTSEDVILPGSGVVQMPGTLRANNGAFTNSLTLNGAAVLTNAPSGSGTANTLAKWSSGTALGSVPNGIGIFTNDGSGGFGFTTNITQDVTVNNITTTNLTVNNTLTVSNITVTNITIQNNLTVSNLYTVNGNHNTLIVTNSIKPLQVGNSKIVRTDASGNLTNATIGTGLAFDGTTLSRDALTGDVTTSGDAATIANNAVSYAKLQDVSATQRVLGRNTAGSGDPEEVTGTQLLDWIGSTQGSVLYRGASSWSALTPGTSGQVLQSGGASANPSWTTVASGSTPGFTIASGLISANLTNIDNGTAGTNGFVIVGGSGNVVTNGNNLLAAYVYAKAANPHASAKSALNRFTIFLLPGLYSLGSGTMTLDTQYIDLVGMSENTGQREDGDVVDFNTGDTIIYSSGNVININNSAQDITLANLCIRTSGGLGLYAMTTTQTAYGAGVTPLRILNVLFVNSNHTGLGLQENKDFYGYWERARCYNPHAFGYSTGTTITIGGTFVRCECGTYGFGGNAGGTTTLSGNFYDIRGDGGLMATGSFGTFSGNFSRVMLAPYSGAGGNFLTGTTFSGYFMECDSSLQPATLAFNGTLTGVMINCRANSGSGGTLTINAGKLINCYFPGSALTLTSGTLKNSVIGNKQLSTAGTSTTGTVNAGGTLKVDTTTTGNVGGGEDNLITYSVPANTLAANGDHLEFDCAGTFNNSTHNKQLKVYFGATAIFDTGSLSGATLGASSWRAHGRIIRTGSATQKATTEFTVSGALLGALTTTTTTYTTAAETLSSASTFKCTGTDLDATPANNEVVQEIESLKWFPVQ